MTRLAPAIRVDPPGTDRAPLFDSIATVYAWVFPQIWHGLFRPVETWVRRSCRGAIKVLDAGTGSGHWANVVERDTATVVCRLDLSPRFLRIARHGPDGRPRPVVQADLLSLPFDDQVFDAVVCAGVLDTLPPVEQALGEFNRVLRPGGHLVMVVRGTDPRVSRLVEVVSRGVIRVAVAARTRSWRASVLGDGVWTREALLPRLVPLCSAAGLDVMDIRPGRFVARVLARRANESAVPSLDGRS